MSTYPNALTNAGLILEQVWEARAGGRLADHYPGWAEVPAVLAARCRKPTKPVA